MCDKQKIKKVVKIKMKKKKDERKTSYFIKIRKIK